MLSSVNTYPRSCTRSKRLLRLGFSDEPARDDRDHRNQDMPGKEVRGPVADDIEPPLAAQQRKQRPDEVTPQPGQPLPAVGPRDANAPARSADLGRPGIADEDDFRAERQHKERE